MSPTESDLPKDPAQYRRGGLTGAQVWALVAFGVVCVFAGAGAATFAPALLRPSPPVFRPVTVPPPPPADPAATVAPPAPAAPTPTAEIDRLNARIAALESEGARSSEAAAAALAAAELLDATQGSRAFARELAALRGAAPDLPELAALSTLAQTGAPSRAALAAGFPDYAAAAARRARKPNEGAPLADRLAYAAAKLVVIRRVDDLSGASPDALLARAEQALNDGDVAGALKLLDGLPPRARAALAAWRAGAERRAEIDRQVAALRARALRDLAPAGGSRP